MEGLLGTGSQQLFRRWLQRHAWDCITSWIYEAISAVTGIEVLMPILSQSQPFLTKTFKLVTAHRLPAFHGTLKPFQSFATGTDTGAGDGCGGSGDPRSAAQELPILCHPACTSCSRRHPNALFVPAHPGPSLPSFCHQCVC